MSAIDRRSRCCFTEAARQAAAAKRRAMAFRPRNTTAPEVFVVRAAPPTCWTSPMSTAWVGSAARLALGSTDVIGLRPIRMAGRGRAARHEAEPMGAETISASVDVAVSLSGGASAALVIGRCREHVAANALRWAA